MEKQAIVITDEGVRHPKGTIVDILIVGHNDQDPKPYYCQAEGGKTCYWYGPDEIEIIGGNDETIHDGH